MSRFGRFVPRFQIRDNNCLLSGCEWPEKWQTAEFSYRVAPDSDLYGISREAPMQCQRRSAPPRGSSIIYRTAIPLDDPQWWAEWEAFHEQALGVLRKLTAPDERLWAMTYGDDCYGAYTDGSAVYFKFWPHQLEPGTSWPLRTFRRR